MYLGVAYTSCANKVSILMDPNILFSQLIPHYPVQPEKKLGYHSSTEIVTWLLCASFLLLTVGERSTAVCSILVWV